MIYFPKRIIDYLHTLLNKRSMIINVLQQYSKYLSNGSYVIRPQYAYNDSDAGNVFCQKELSNMLSKLMFAKKYQVHNETNLFAGTLVIINSNKFPKIFNFESHEVLTFDTYKNIEKLTLARENMKIFFHFVPLLAQDKDHYVEQYVSSVPSVNKEQLVIEIFETYLSYFAAIGTAQNEKVLPRCNLHGDLCFKNLIISRKIYFIDWERFGEFNIYYDFINLFIVEIIDSGNYFYINEFLKGKYDEFFIRAGDCFNHDFSAHHKYFYIEKYFFERAKIMSNKYNYLFQDILEKYKGV